MLFLFDWWPAHRYVNLACVLLSPAPHRALQRWRCDVPEVRLDSSLVNRWVSQQQQSLHHPRVWLTWSFTWIILCFAFIFSSKYTHKLCFPSFSASLSVSSISSYGLQAFVISSHFLLWILAQSFWPLWLSRSITHILSYFCMKELFQVLPLFFYESALKVQFFLLLSPWGSLFMSIQLIFSCDNPFCYRQTTQAQVRSMFWHNEDIFGDNLVTSPELWCLN